MSKVVKAALTLGLLNVVLTFALPKPAQAAWQWNICLDQRGEVYPCCAWCSGSCLGC